MGRVKSTIATSAYDDMHGRSLLTSCLASTTKQGIMFFCLGNLKLDNLKFDRDLRVFFSTLLDKQCMSDATLDWNGWNSVAHFSFGNSFFE